MSAKKVEEQTELWPVLVKFPMWLIDDLDAEAKRLGIPRVFLIIQLCVDGLKKGKRR